MYRGENKVVRAIGAYILHVLHEVACKNPWHSHHKAQAQTQGLSTIATRTCLHSSYCVPQYLSQQ